MNKMHLLLYILLYLMPKALAKQIEIKCPEHCRCDIFENLKRANCTNRNLAKVESNFPQQTQLLDLSYNQISSLDAHVFTDEKLLSLKLLNISHNKLSEIHMSAFKGLDQLKTLDLSHNGIRYILENWFKDLKALSELYLNGNSFSRLEDGEIFSSTSLKKLDLSDCHISSIEPSSLANLPSLEILELSGNYLLHLNVSAIKSLPNLTILNINNTHLACDGEFESLLSYCTDKGIRFVHPCNKKESSKIEKSQKMVNMAPPEDEKNSWIFDEDETRNDTETKIITVCNNTREDKSLLQEIVDLSPVLSLVFPFIYGIAVGVLIACIVHLCKEKKKRDLHGSTYLSFDDGNRHLQRRNRLSFKGFNRSQSSEDRQNLPLREWNLSESTPVLFRKNQMR